jgi:hypothetical protein|tara:strand:+ start:1789 stop:2445 length:657 start_codon:yes stop_codon:yes gene_type:complete
MSLLNTASPWNNDTTRKRVPSMKRATAKIRPSNAERQVSFSDIDEQENNIVNDQNHNDNNNINMHKIIGSMTTEDDGSNLYDFQPLEPPSLNSQSANTSETDISSHLSLDAQELLPQTSNRENSNFASNHSPKQFLSNYHEIYNLPKMPKPVYGLPNSSNTNIDDKLWSKINYMIHLLEEQQNEKTAYVTEEFILYAFLGIFVIYAVDTFTRNGKYVR